MAGAWQQRQPDLAGIYESAMQARMQREQLELQKQAQARMEKQAEVEAATAQRRLDFEAKKQAFEQKRQQQEYDIKDREQNSLVQNNTNRYIDEMIRGSMTPTGEVDPGKFNRGMFQMGVLAAKGQVDKEAYERLKTYGVLPDAERLAEEQRGVQGAMSAASELKSPGGDWNEVLGQWQAQKGTPADWATAMRTDPELMAQLWERSQAEKGARADAVAKGRQTTIINQMPGEAKMTTAGITGVDEKLSMIRDYREKNKAIRPLINSENFGLIPDIKEWVGIKIGKIDPNLVSPELKRVIDSRGEMRSLGLMMQYDLLVALSGKAVTEREYERIRRAVGNPDDMSMDEYLSAVQAMDKVMGYMENRYAKMRRPGYGQSWITDQEDEKFVMDKVAAADERLAAGDIDEEQYGRLMGTIERQALMRIRRREAGLKEAAPSAGQPSATPTVGGDAGLDRIRQLSERVESGKATPAEQSELEDLVQQYQE